MKIVIAEDEPTSRRILEATLSKLGYEVHATSNGREALQALSAPGAPKLAILDWMMPEVDGPEVCRRLRYLPTEEPPYVILLTANGTKEHVVEGLESGADDFLVKPFNHGELRARLQVGRRLIELQ